ncbi:MAG: helicase-related protein, partial [Candidatus Methanosuratincola sp.]
ETVEYLKEMLKEFGPLEITGEIDMEERKRTVDRFASDPSNRVLIGTDAMGESLNLQAASVEVNYEVPWSPVAYIQRVGRIWRLKQEHKHLLIINFLPPFPVEKRVMEVMLEKIRRINEEFGEIGLSVFGRELGTVDGIIKEAYTGTSVSADATASVDAGEGPEKGVVRAEEMIERAFLESQKIGREVVEVLNSSMALPRLVNVESLQMRKVLDLSDIATEEDLKRLLRYLKDAGVGYGEFPESYHVMLGNEYVRVDSLSFESGGMQAAIAAGKSVLPPPNRVRFNYVKDMVGWLMRAVVEVGGRTVYEEPVLFTLDGVLNYRGVLSLAPDFTCKITAPHFVPLDEYRSRAAARWLEREHALWEGEKKRLMREYEFEDNDIKKNAISRSLSEWLSKEPKESSVSVEFVPLRRECTGIGVGEGPSVEFVGFSPEEWRVRLEVEMMAMKTALEYYTQKGYDVKDVSRENRGYDLECASPNDILRVEVKGLRGGTSPVLTQNERSAAAFYRDSFVLFVVKEDVSGKRHIFEVTDPIRNLDLKEVPRPFYEAHGFNRFLVEIRPPLLDA